MCPGGPHHSGTRYCAITLPCSPTFWPRFVRTGASAGASSSTARTRSSCSCRRWRGAEPGGPAKSLCSIREIRSAETKARIAAIIHTTRDDGAGDGWSALYLPQITVAGLKASFGTKLLYFAGYDRSPGNPPLILDVNVMTALTDPRSQTGSTFRGCRPWHREWYERYLCLAATWAAEASWNEKPEVVEYALFEHGRKLRRERL